MMKRVLRMAMVVVLVTAVGGSVAGGTMARFFDTEVSRDNEFGAGTRSLEISGGPVAVTCGLPCKWYSEEFILVNTGNLDGVAIVHIPAVDFNGAKGVRCREAGTVPKGTPPQEYVYDGTTGSYVVGSPVGAGVASSETEFAAEEGGQFGNMWVTGLGADAGDDNGPPQWVMSRFIEVKMWFDENDDGDYLDPGELIVEGKLADIACTTYALGLIPAGSTSNIRGGGWGSYFECSTGTLPEQVPLLMGQNYQVGTITVWRDGASLCVAYDTTSTGWQMAVTHLYVGTAPPAKLAPGSFPYQHDPVPPPGTQDLYKVPIPAGTDLYIAAHAEGVDRETAWGSGVTRRFKIELHLVQVEDPAWFPTGIDYDGDGDVDDDDAQVRWWPTNIFQGDTCTFDLLFDLVEE